MSRETQIELLQFDIHCWAEADISHEHHGSGYEEPLMHVVTARYVVVGSRLQGVTAADIKNRRIGFFKYDKSEPTVVTR